MKEFKVGDKVRIIKSTSGVEEDNPLIGKIGYIGEIDQLSSYPYSVYSEPERKGKYLSIWKADDLELVTKKVTKKEKTLQGEDFKCSQHGYDLRICCEECQEKWQKFSDINKKIMCINKEEI